MLDHEFLFHRQDQTFRRIITRRAVRAVIQPRDQILLIHSTRVGDYKFPGGGVKPGESAQSGLLREVMEECGRVIASMGPAFIRTVEKLQAVEAEDAAFHLISEYYLCTLTDEVLPQRLDDYEAELGFQPVWIPLAEALEANRAILYAEGREKPRWLEREIWVMESLLAAC